MNDIEKGFACGGRSVIGVLERQFQMTALPVPLPMPPRAIHAG
jgi:hypothetical protein